MLSKLILLMLLVNLLTALPAPESGNPSSAQKACADVSRTSRLSNEDDPTCSTYIYCYFANGSVYGLTYTCKQGTYFDDSSKLCTAIKPDICT